MRKMENEVEEILMGKGITKERVREIEEEVREAAERKYGESQVSYSDKSGNVMNPLDFKMAVRTEIKKKERLLELNMKKKLKNEMQKMRKALEDEFQAKQREVMKQVEEERLELSRKKSTFNIRGKKLNEMKREIENKLTQKEEKYQKLVKDLKAKLEKTTKERDDALERGHKLFKRKQKRSTNTNVFNNQESVELELTVNTSSKEAKIDSEKGSESDQIYSKPEDSNTKMKILDTYDSAMNRQTFGVVEEKTQLFPINSEEQRNEGKKIFSQIINDGNLRLLSRDQDQDYRFGTVNKEVEIEENFVLPETMTDRSPFDSEFREANKIRLDSNATGDFGSLKNEGKNEGQNFVGLTI
jgi:hypothetical protein